MSDLGQFQGQWLGKWHGGVEELPPGFVAGNASFSINAIGTLSGVTDDVTDVIRGKRYEITYEQAKREWDAKAKWRDESARWADVTPMAAEVTTEVTAEVEPIKLEAIIPRLDVPLFNLADLLADTKLLQLEQAQALESAMAVRDVIKLAELAYLAELAVQQEKDAIAALILFMD
jgi:hypothetical protein